MKTFLLTAATALALAGSLHAGSRASASYSVAADTINAGGQRTTTVAYRNDGSLGGIAGLSTVAAPVQVARHGYIGQLVDPAGLMISANPITLNEGGTRQLAAFLSNDDGTVASSLAAASVAWSVLSGPLSGVSAGGLATATNVYVDSPATVQGAYSGLTGTLGLFVFNTGIDDFAFYAGDGLDDAWQVQYFGENNPNALSGADPDGDGQTNYFEYVATTIPTDASSKFRLNIDPVNGQPTYRDIRFSPLSVKRVYTVQERPLVDLGLFTPTLGPLNEVGGERIITDTNAVGAAKFYRVNIDFP